MTDERPSAGHLCTVAQHRPAFSRHVRPGRCSGNDRPRRMACHDCPLPHPARPRVRARPAHRDVAQVPHAHARLTRRLDEELRRRTACRSPSTTPSSSSPTAPGRRIRMNVLAERVILLAERRSRGSSTASGRDGSVERTACATDARGQEAVLTPAGLDRLRTAADDPPRRRPPLLPRAISTAPTSTRSSRASAASPTPLAPVDARAARGMRRRPRPDGRGRLLRPGRAGSPTRPGRRGSTRPGCAATACCATTASRLATRRAEQHVLPPAEPGRRSTAGSPRRRPTSGSRSRPSAAASFRSLQVDPGDERAVADRAAAAVRRAARDRPVPGPGRRRAATTSGWPRSSPRGRATCRSRWSSRTRRGTSTRCSPRSRDAGAALVHDRAARGRRSRRRSAGPGPFLYLRLRRHDYTPAELAALARPARAVPRRRARRVRATSATTRSGRGAELALELAALARRRLAETAGDGSGRPASPRRVRTRRTASGPR